ncbi:MAG: carboxypeptidase M32 [Planctomycetes bacterium]|nr:carboxypeptidase M32 [Planctomycetota bacterium]
MQTYDDLVGRVRERGLLESIGSVLGWDERTHMPPCGSAHRAEQMALVARLGHEKLTDPKLKELLADLEASPPMQDAASEPAVNVREIRRLHDRAAKIPPRLVEELARTTTRAQQVWQQARHDNDFTAFQPWLDKVVALKREEAQAVGYRDVPYDALLDEYEPGATTTEVTKVFAELRAELTPLVAAIAASGKCPRRDILERDYPVDRQALFGEAAAAAIGFDFAAGRLDVTAHPFCSGIGPGDCRLTTRYHPRDFRQGFFGILHEAGHGIYEQGLPGAHFGTPLGSAASLGIHESQSRLWENQVGRGRAFWEHFFPRARQVFAAALRDTSLDDFLFAVNDLQPSYIRVEADEATYNLHIILRFELEQALVAGDLQAADVPTAWNEKFHAMFHLMPPDFARGCLQDIHWSMGGIGYFPTYTLGNLYAAQFMDRARADLPGLEDDFRRGDFARLKTWLNDRIHRHGQRFRARDLCQRVTGAAPSHQPLIRYLRGKFGEFYGV